MPAVESPAGGAGRSPETTARRRRVRRPSAFALGLAAVLAGGLLLRLWGLRAGLPWVFNVDEGAHFVPRAIGMFDHSYDPGYFINPPGFTYLLHVLFWLRWGGEEVRALFATDPAAVWTFARATSAVLATASAGLLAWAAVRLFDRQIALVAAGLLAVAFLPVHYGHFALNDAPTLAPVALSLAGAAGILRTGRTRDYVLAGAGLGLAAAFKYTAGIVLVPLLAAAAMAPGPPLKRLRDLAVAGAVAGAAFFAANPYAFLDPEEFRTGLREQSEASSDGGGKLGLANDTGFTYYGGTVAWGLGVLPGLAALAGALWLAARDRRTAAVLVPMPVLFLLFMGAQDRFFARWLLPVYPVLALLAAWVAVQAVRGLRERSALVRRSPEWLPVAVVGALLGAQGLVYAVHNDVVLSRTDTRALARAWMVENIPEGAKIVMEPIAPAPFVQDIGAPSRATSSGDRWIKRRTSHFRVARSGALVPLPKPKLEDYQRTLRPDLVGSYTRGGYCWLVSGSTQYGRSQAEPDEAPHALRYYEEVRRVGEVVYETSPFDPGADEPPFSFDDSFNYRPLGYARPGPRIVVYRLRGDRCG